MGALIMAHGDDAGLRVPPRLAPVQVVVLAVRTEDGAGEAAAALAEQLRAAGIRVELDVRTDLSFGRRVVDWELKGVPVRVEVGPGTWPQARWCYRGATTPPRPRCRWTASWPSGDRGARIEPGRPVRRGAPPAGGEHRRAPPPSRRPRRRRNQALPFVPGEVLAADDGEGRLNAGGITVRLLQRPDGSLPGPGDDVAELEAVVARAY